MRVSVIVPLYNKANYIERCLQSILGQSFQDFEILVVDDGSTDGGVEIVQRCGDPRLRLLSQPNAGPGAARNMGANQARGDLIAPLDADDVWEAEYLRESVRWLDGYGEDVACLSWGMWEHPPGTSTEGRWKRLGIPEGVFRMEPGTPVRLLVALAAHMLPSSTVVRREVYRQLGGFYEKNRCRYSEDAYLWLKILCRHPVALHARPMVHKYEDAAQLSRNLPGVRPIEPFLLEPEGLMEGCPPELKPLLRAFLAARACKTASVYGYWGQWREARRLVRRFVRPQDWRQPYFITALAGSTPLGGWAGRLARGAAGRHG